VLGTLDRVRQLEEVAGFVIGLAFAGVDPQSAIPAVPRRQDPGRGGTRIPRCSWCPIRSGTRQPGRPSLLYRSLIAGTDAGGAGQCPRGRTGTPAVAQHPHRARRGDSRNQLTPLVAIDGARPLHLALLSPAEAPELDRLAGYFATLIRLPKLASRKVLQAALAEGCARKVFGLVSGSTPGTVPASRRGRRGSPRPAAPTPPTQSSGSATSSMRARSSFSRAHGLCAAHSLPSCRTARPGKRTLQVLPRVRVSGPSRRANRRSKPAPSRLVRVRSAAAAAAPAAKG